MSKATMRTDYDRAVWRKVLAARKRGQRILVEQDGTGFSIYALNPDKLLGCLEDEALVRRIRQADMGVPQGRTLMARDTLRISRATYRGTAGFKLTGRPPGQFGGYPLSIFSEYRDRLERIRELYRSDLRGEELWKATGRALHGETA